MTETTDRLIPLRDVTALVGLGHSTIYAGIKAGTFPRPVKIGSASRWSEREVRDWIAKQLDNRLAA